MSQSLTHHLSLHTALYQVGALSCAFVREHARDRDECMISLCTFGKLVFAGRNNSRKVAKQFKSVLDHTCLKAIMTRFNHFNEHGGAFVRMDDHVIHFERACLVGIFADLPAATKLLLTGSSCNTCFLPRNQMAEPNTTADLRTWDNMNDKAAAFRARIAAGEGVTAVSDEAKKMGVNYLVRSAFSIPTSGINPIGPDSDLDNPWGCSPAVYLHAMEAGTLMKLCETTLNYIIQKSAILDISATEACRRVDQYCAKVYVACPHNSNIEIGTMALLPKPHGISAHIYTGKSLDGHQRSTVARLMHMYVATCDIFNEHQRMQHCQMYELVWKCREQMSWPLHRCRFAEVQDELNQMDRNLITYMGPFSASQCRSEKHHQWAHYSHHRLSTGCAAKEYAFERSYAVGHKKQVQFTNKSQQKALQTSAKHWFRNGVQRLALHVGIVKPKVEDDVDTMEHQERMSHLQNATSMSQFKWPSEVVKRILRNKANAAVPPLRLVRASNTIHVTLKNRMTLKGKPGRMVNIILRATHGSKNIWVDNIRVQYTDNSNLPKVGFAKCIGFFGDIHNNDHVAIQWYKICGRQPVQRIARMCKVELMESYQYVPLGSILNGALIVPLATEPLPGCPQQYWVVQSHREGVALERLNR